MILHGFVMSAELAENPPGSARIEMALRIQGVGPGQPRRIVIPYDVLLADPSIDGDDIVGQQASRPKSSNLGPSRWDVRRISPGGARVLRGRRWNEVGRRTSGEQSPIEAAT